MNNEQFQRAEEDMNIDQRRICNLITESIRRQLNGEEQRERIFITGGAGTGKTFLLKLLKNRVNECYGKSAVKVGASTGVAALLAGGSTLHCLLDLPLKIGKLPSRNDDYLRVMRERGQWQNVEFLFIDNISVVSSEMLGMIDTRLRELKCKHDFFGGINVILFGDLMQLPPIEGQKIFQHPFPLPFLWRLFKMIELQQNMRQQGDGAFIDILDALRVGQLTPEHLDILSEKVLTDATNEFSIERVLRIYPTNPLVGKHNKKVIQHFQREGKTIYTIKAQDQPKFNSTIIEHEYLINNSNADSDDIILDDINATGGLPKVLEIFEGAKVMLRSNIDIEKGPINGSMGIITQIIWPFFEPDQVYNYDMNIPSVCVDFGPEFDGVHKIEPIERKFPVKKNRYGIDECSRRMLPLILIWASTVNMIQGCEVDKAVVYLGSSLFKTGQAYVALSCIKSLDGLQIEELDRSKLMGEDMCDMHALAEMRRLRINE